MRRRLEKLRWLLRLDCLLTPLFLPDHNIMLHPSLPASSPGGKPESISHCTQYSTRPTLSAPRRAFSRARAFRDRALREHRRPIRPASLTLLVVTRTRSLYNPAPASRWTDRTTQPCEHTDDSPLTNSLAHPRLAVSHQRRDLYRPRQYLSDRASDDAGLWDDRSRDGTGKEGTG